MRSRFLSAAPLLAGLARAWLPEEKIRGVNLGSSFIIEPWMAVNEWSSMGCDGANDEWQCVQQLGQEAADAAFQKHWASWVTREDLSNLAGYGINTVRIPVGFWIKEDLVDRSYEYFPKGGLEHLDNVVGWANELGLYVIMDLHAGPGGQAAKQQFTGHSVDPAGWFETWQFERTYQWLDWMTERIHTNEAYRSVGMLQLMNEPDRGYDNLVWEFYPNAWDRIKSKESSLDLPNGPLHIQMMNELWGAGKPDVNLDDKTNAAYDNHKYYTWDESTERTHEAYMRDACNYDSGSDGLTPVITAEWSLGVPGEIGGWDEWEVESDNNLEFYSNWFLAQAQSFEKHQGWVYWSWKVQQGRDFRWSFQTGIERGVIPKDLSTISNTNVCDGV